MVKEIHYSPPTLTKTWFHLGPIGPAFGDWQEDLDWSSEFWSGDPALLDHKEFVTPFLRALGRNDPHSRRIRRDAVRTLRGSIVRTELYALDGSPNQTRPYTVTESQYDLREIDPPPAGDRARQRIFFSHLRGQRTTQWERGDDPLTVFEFTDNYDDYGQPQQTTSIACPRGWRNIADRPAAGYLATRKTTQYASPWPNGPYIHDRVAVNTTFEITGSATRTIAELRALAAGGLLNIIEQTLNYYDGTAFTGLERTNFGKIGLYGALTRTEQLVLTDRIVGNALQNTGVSAPPWLNRRSNVWSADYPYAFQQRVPSLGGYLYNDGTDGFHAPGYFAATVRKANDIQRGIGARGLVVAQRDPLGYETAIQYDRFELLPLKITDPVHLEVAASYNYRLLQPEQVTDPNGNSTVAAYSPIGLLAKTWVKGKAANEGDAVRPSVELTYDFLAFEKSGEPMSVRTLRYEHHDADAYASPAERTKTIETREYSDGFGRLLQTRTQALDVIFGDSTLGTDVLPTDATVAPGPIRGALRKANAPPHVVVSGWQVYDNNGQVVQKYEPFFDQGWDYDPPAESKLGKNITMFYDPRGHVIRTINPDGSEQKVIYGVPNDLNVPPQSASDTEKFRPSPWEVYTYDANDNAGRTHAAAAQNYRHHWNTPASIVIDALGRTVETVQRNRNAPGDTIEEYRTRTTYDIRGNVIAIFDALGRPAFNHVFDLANRRWRLDSIDAGLRLTFFDAAGNLVETRDAKGAVALRAYDDTNRPTHLWARDALNEQVTLREELDYGDQLADQADAKSRNLRGRLYRHRDEAGQMVFAVYDFKGNLLEKIRNVIDPDQLANAAFRVNWEAGGTPQLSSTDYRVSTTYDALNRITAVQYPLDVDGERKKLTPLYNRAGALESVKLNGAIVAERIAYNAKGQRTLIAYGNNLLTAYEYDKDTFRLLRMWTSVATKTGGIAAIYQPTGAPLQNLSYSYDLVGNVTSIVEVVSGCGIRNNVADAQYQNLGPKLAAGDALVRKFRYDALYRLTAATGREATNIQSPPPWADTFHPEGFNWGTLAVPNPGNARDLTRTYVESYAYDPAGNMMKLRHDFWWCPMDT